MSKEIISIGDTSIAKSSNGLYCLTDLWKASGGRGKDKPANWMRSSGTKQFVKFLEEKYKMDNQKRASVNNQLVTEVIYGDGGGTYIFVRIWSITMLCG